jgi:hypothetical protein
VFCCPGCRGACLGCSRLTSVVGLCGPERASEAGKNDGGGVGAVGGRRWWWQARTREKEGKRERRREKRGTKLDNRPTAADGGGWRRMDVTLRHKRTNLSTCPTTTFLLFFVPGLTSQQSPSPPAAISLQPSLSFSFSFLFLFDYSTNTQAHKQNTQSSDKQTDRQTKTRKQLRDRVQ